MKHVLSQSHLVLFVHIVLSLRPAQRRQVRMTALTLSIDALVSACNADTEDSFVVVEGAGGLYSPIADASLNSDLAKRLQVPVVIVIRDELGAISQALLTIEAAKKNKLTRFMRCFK